MNRSFILCLVGTALLACNSVFAQVNIVTLANGDVAGLKTALTAANSNGKDDIINLATNGTYTLTTVDNVTTGATGLPVIGPDSGHSVTIHGHGATINRTGSTPLRILQTAASSNVFIDNLTITNALIANFGPGNAIGAAIYNNNGTLTLTSCVFTSNSVHGVNGGNGISVEPNGNPGDAASGGAIYSVGTMTLTGCTFTNNSATGGIGGNGFGSSGIPGVGGTASGGAIYGSPTMVACSFTGNTALGGDGGGSASGPAVAGSALGGAVYGGSNISKSTFSNSLAIVGSGGGGGFTAPAGSFGGALFGAASVSESSFISNNAQYGGALDLPGTLDSTPIPVSGCFFQNDFASIDGGVVYLEFASNFFFNTFGVVAMTNCTISGCSAPHGAVIYNKGVAALVNCTLDGNTSSAAGAGALETDLDNSESSASAIALTNSILKTGSTGANVADRGIASHGHNISSDNAAGLLTATGDKPNTDPLFISDTPQDNGGPTKTIGIGLFGSGPAINAGDDSAAPHRDQRGYFRTGHSDIGAYEYFGGLTGSSTIARNGNDIIVSAEVVYGHSYQLERKLNLTDTNWTAIGNEFTATNNDIEAAPIATGDFTLGRAFYHIKFTN